MELSPELIRELQMTFSAELDEQCQVMSDALLALEKNTDSQSQQALINVLFRAAHNIKGAARGIDVHEVGTMAHRMETLFSAIKNGHCVMSPALADICFECLDNMKQAMAAFIQGQASGLDLIALLVKFDPFDQLPTQDGLLQKTTSLAVSPDGVEVIPRLTADADSERDDSSAGTVNADGADNVRSYSQKMAVPAENSRDQTSAGKVQRELVKSGFVRISLEKLNHVSTIGEELQLVKIEAADQSAQLSELLKYVEELSFLVNRLSLPGENAPGIHKKIEVQLLDRTTELESGIRQSLHRQKRNVKHASQVLTALQSEIQSLRLVPIGNLLQMLARPVRDIARELGKQVQFNTWGEHIEIDRMMLESIKDPLMHLIRNALDHGIELPTKRLQQGKAKQGLLCIGVATQGSRIVLSVQDDGKGIDVDEIRRVVEHRKLLSVAELEIMTDEQIRELIFHPGFSTAKIITEVSGRGIGLDVVKENLLSINADVQVATAVNVGTTITLSLPLTLATDRGLIVRCAAANYAIPLTNVSKVLFIDRSDIVEVEATQVVIINDRAIVLRDLAFALGSPAAVNIADLQLQVVIVKRGWQEVAFLVSDVVGEREIVIKRFMPPLIAVANVIGGTMSGNGEVMMVLNPNTLVANTLNAKPGSWALKQASEQERAPQEILVVDDSITTRTLERNILETAGYHVSVAVDGNKAWELIQTQHFDLVVTDIEMPEMDGFELTERIKTSEKYRHLPVIVVTSLASDTDKKRGIVVGADAYIVKSHFETKALLDVVRQIL